MFLPLSLSIPSFTFPSSRSILLLKDKKNKNPAPLCPCSLIALIAEINLHRMSLSIPSFAFPSSRSILLLKDQKNKNPAPLCPCSLIALITEINLHRNKPQFAIAQHTFFPLLSAHRPCFFPFPVVSTQINLVSVMLSQLSPVSPNFSVEPDPGCHFHFLILSLSSFTIPSPPSTSSSAGCCLFSLPPPASDLPNFKETQKHKHLGDAP